MRVRKKLRYVAMGLATVTGLSRKGFFIPYRFAGRLPAEAPYYSALAERFESKRPVFAHQISALEAYAGELEAIGVDDPPEPRWNQGWFPRLDAAVAYAMVRGRRPHRIVEVGSGHSTRFLVRAVRDSGLDVHITCIDPAPRASLDRLDVEHRPRPVGAADIALFNGLEPGDMVFIDSSHILMPGSDADFLINVVWPTLPTGVIVHIHDVFLPDDYPRAWRWRGYNEQLGVAPLITSSAADILFASHYVVTRMSDVVDGSVLGRLPLFDGAVESSLWIQKRAAPEAAG